MSEPIDNPNYQALVGKTIVRVRHLNDAEIKDLEWYCDFIETTVLEFSDNTYAIVMCDPEGNGEGHLEFGKYKIYKTTEGETK